MRRGIAIAIAIGLALGAAWLWSRPAALPAGWSDGPPSHGDPSDEDREALREILREEGAP